MEKNPQLQHRALSQQTLVLGLPTPVFAIALLITLFGAGLLLSSLGLVLGLLSSIALALLVFRPLQAIHKNDVQAWRLWLRAFHGEHFTSHLVQKKTVLIQTKQHLLTFKHWRKTQ